MITKFIKSTIKSILFKTNWRLKKKYINRSYTNKKPDLDLIRCMHECKGIIHMGAHRGTEAAIYDWFHKPVVWFEANPFVIQELKDHVEQYPNQKVIHSLLGSTDDSVINFNISNNDSASSSIFQFGKDSKSKNLKMVQSVELKSKKFDSLVKEYSIDILNFDFWILDLQGSELMALNGAQKSLKNCNSLLVEVSKDDQYLNAPRWEDIKKFLNQFNFYPHQELEDAHSDILFTKRK